MNTIDKVIRRAADRGMTQQALEQQCGLPPGRISKWKSGVGEPSAGEIWRIAQCLEIDVQVLLDDRMGLGPTP